jgi:hypothetical protein
MFFPPIKNDVLVASKLLLAFQRCWGGQASQGNNGEDGHPQEGKE